MPIRIRWMRATLLPALIAIAACTRGRVETVTPRGAEPGRVAAAPSAPASVSGVYPNLFVSLLGRTDAEVNAKIDSAFGQLFHGDPETQAVYFPVGGDMAYVEDILHQDVRSEGMSYGLMIAVQLDRKQEFDRLWRWMRTHMQHQAGPRAGYFAWQLRPDGSVMDSTAAPDGEEWTVTALLFASARWGDSSGIDYRAEAQRILDAMLHRPADPGDITNMFDPVRRQVVFVPNTEASGFTDPSYHLPHYYELWARRATTDNAFWCDAASASRRFLQRAAHPRTGLSPDYASFDGAPVDRFKGGHDAFRFDAWRVAMNVAADHVWFGKDPWQVEQSNTLLGFFRDQGLDTYPNQFTLDGRPLSANHSPGLVAMNAVAALAATRADRADFVRALWELPVPSGPGRYYDGLLYLLGMLNVSGNFRIYLPNGTLAPPCG